MAEVHPLAHTCHWAWLAIPSQTLKFSSQGIGLGFSTPAALPNIILSFLVTWFFSSSLYPPGLLVWLAPPHLSSRGSGSIPLWTLPDVPASGYLIPFIYSKLSSPPDLAADVSFPFFYFFFHSYHREVFV